VRDFALTDDLIVFVSVSGEDAHHVDRWLAEMTRLETMFVVHFDRCSERMKQRFMWSRNLFGFTEQNDPAIEFTEQHKQGAMDLAQGSGRRWALALDIDETLEKLAVEKLAAMIALDRGIDGGTHVDVYDCRWLNLWGDKWHIRADAHWLHGHRACLYNIGGGRKWRFDHPITNGAKLVDRPDTGIVAKLDLVVLHWGAILPEWRAVRKSRWDRIYGAAVGENPYGHWRAEADETGLKVIEHDYLPK
jgi:hypothetical protein